MLTLAGLNVLLAAEAKAGMQVKAIAEDRMKVMRRMGDLALVQFNRDMRWLNLMGVVCRTMASAAVMAITKRSIPGLEKSVPAGRSAIKKIEMRGYSP